MGASRRETLRAKVDAARAGLAEKRDIVARAPEDRKRLIAEKERLTRETAAAKSEVAKTAKIRDDAEREEKRAKRAEERLAAKTKANPTEDAEDVEAEAETPGAESREPVAETSEKSEAERRVEEAAANVAAAEAAREAAEKAQKTAAEVEEIDDDDDEAPEGETDEERGQRIARQWIKDGREETGGASAEDDSRILADVDDDATDPNADANRHEEYDPEDDDEETYGDDSDSDAPGSGSGSGSDSAPPSGGFSKFLSGSWFGGGGEKDATRRVRDRAVAATNAARSARSAADAASATLRDLESKLDDATVNLARYVGPRAEFAHMIGACYEAEVDKYAYSVCPFAEAKQDSTRLGTMTPLVANPNDPSEVPSTFSFVAGESCWNGPKRSMTVRLACGDATRLGGVTEPSRCEYAATLETPAACDEREAEALEAELREMEAEAEAAGREEL